MIDFSNPHGFRKAVAGIGMVLAPVLFLAGTIVSPALDSDAATQLANVAEHPDRWLIAMFLFLLGWAAIVPAILGMMHMLRERESSLGHLGGAIALLGVLASVGYIAMGFVMWQMATPAADAAQMTALLERLTDTAGTFIPFFAMGFAVAVGVLVLCAGLLRAHAAPLWIIAPIAAAQIAFALGMALYSMPVLLVSSAALLVGLGSLGRETLTEPVEAWEHTPDRRAFPTVVAH